MLAPAAAPPAVVVVVQGQLPPPKGFLLEAPDRKELRIEENPQRRGPKTIPRQNYLE